MLVGIFHRFGIFRSYQTLRFESASLSLSLYQCIKTNPKGESPVQSPPNSRANPSPHLTENVRSLTFSPLSPLSSLLSLVSSLLSPLSSLLSPLSSLLSPLLCCLGMSWLVLACLGLSLLSFPGPTWLQKSTKILPCAVLSGLGLSWAVLACLGVAFSPQLRPPKTN